MSSRIIPALARAASTSAVSTGKHKVVVIGGGAGGLAAANQIYNGLRAQGKTLAPGDIAIVDAAAHHDYQPGWTVVGSGLADKQSFRRPMASLIPDYFAHVQSAAKEFEPATNQVVLSDGSKVAYDYLVVAPGLQINWENIKGLKEAIADPIKNSVSSIYSYETADKTWQLVEGYKPEQGQAVFTQPFGIVKCAGAPQKMLYMADSYWKSVNTNVQSTFMTGMPSMFAVPKYSAALNAIRESKGLGAQFNHNLVEVRAADKVAVFEVLAGDDKGARVEVPYGLLHVVPPMGPRDVIKRSPLADAAGWVDVSAASLQHNTYGNVFALGDASSLPTSKTAAAITAEAPVLAHNLIAHMETGKVGTAAYDGYTSCPLFTGRGELLLAEFVYGAKPKETFGALVDQSKPNRAFYHLTKDIFPRVYFSHLVKGNWFGPKGVFPPQFVPT